MFHNYYCNIIILNWLLSSRQYTCIKLKIWNNSILANICFSMYKLQIIYNSETIQTYKTSLHKQTNTHTHNTLRMALHNQLVNIACWNFQSHSYTTTNIKYYIVIALSKYKNTNHKCKLVIEECVTTVLMIYHSIIINNIVLKTPGDLSILTRVAWRIYIYISIHIFT